MSEEQSDAAVAVPVNDTEARDDAQRGEIEMPPWKVEGNEWRKYAAVRLTTEFDSEDCVLKNKICARVLDGIGKIKAVVTRDKSGHVSCPEVGFVSKYLSVLFDPESRNASISTSGCLARGLTVKLNGDVRMETKYLSVLCHPDGCNMRITGSADLIRHLQIKVCCDTKAHQGEMKLLTNFQDSKYAAEICCAVPTFGVPRTVFTFPLGEVCLQGKSDAEKGLTINGFVAKKFSSGLWMAEYVDTDLNLRYQFKDEEMTFRPTLSLPSNDLSVMFARQFNAENKLNMHYNFNSGAWSSVYKFKPVSDFKIKAGYDSAVPLAWLSTWIGREDTGAKTAPGKTKIQVMLQVPPGDVKKSALLLRFKKRWDL